MRTTITITDDTFATVSNYANSIADKLAFKRQDGIWMFDLPPATPRVTAQQVQQLLDEKELNHAKKGKHFPL